MITDPQYILKETNTKYPSMNITTMIQDFVHLGRVLMQVRMNDGFTYKETLDWWNGVASDIEKVNHNESIQLKIDEQVFTIYKEGATKQ